MCIRDRRLGDRVIRICSTATEDNDAVKQALGATAASTLANFAALLCYYCLLYTSRCV